MNISVEGWERPSDLGIVVAYQKGFFADENMNAWVGAPADPSGPIKYVIEGGDTFGVAPLPQVAIASAKGAPIVAIGSLISQSTGAMIWLPRSGIDSLADLKGKTVVIPGLPYQRDFLADVLARAGLTLGDVEVKSVGNELVPALLAGRAAAIFGGSWNLEGARLEALGAKPVITRMKSLGGPAHEDLVVIARKDLLGKNPGLARRFMSAVRRGTAFALEKPEAAMKVMGEADELDPKIAPRLIRAEVKATLPILSKTGRIDPRAVNGLVRWMHKQKIVPRGLRIPEFMSNLKP